MKDMTNYKVEFLHNNYVWLRYNNLELDTQWYREQRLKGLLDE